MNAFEVAVLFAIPGFILLMLLEFAYSRLSGSDSWSNQADAISSISSGLTYLALRTLEFGVLVISYELLFTWLAPPPLDAGVLLYGLVFVWKDFTGYWIHRWAHANSFLWAMHLIHHSSEEFNLAVALRQNAFNWFSYGGLMFLPLILLGVPVEVVAVVAPLHFFLQFWYHTRHIGKLGWLEYVIVTPSQHRVHHAINPRYIDRNFGQIFCWDRLFGTFQEELDTDPPAYGITTPARSYNPVRIELDYMGRLLRDAWHSRGWNRLRVFFSRTGWRPEDARRRWPEPKRDYQKPEQKYRVALTAGHILWGWCQLGALLGLTAWLLSHIASLSVGDKVALLLFVVAGIYANSQQLMRAGSAWVELSRLGLLAYLALNSSALPGWGLALLALLAGVSLAVTWQSRESSAPIQVVGAVR